MFKKCRIWITQCLLSYSMLFLLTSVQLQATCPFFFFFGPTTCRIPASWLGFEPAPLHWECAVLITGPPGKSLQDPFLSGCLAVAFSLLVFMWEQSILGPNTLDEMVALYCGQVPPSQCVRVSAGISRCYAVTMVYDLLLY